MPIDTYERRSDHTRLLPQSDGEPPLELAYESYCIVMAHRLLGYAKGELELEPIPQWLDLPIAQDDRDESKLALKELLQKQNLEELDLDEGMILDHLGDLYVEATPKFIKWLNGTHWRSCQSSILPVMRADPSSGEGVLWLHVIGGGGIDVVARRRRHHQDLLAILAYASVQSDRPGGNLVNAAYKKLALMAFPPPFLQAK